MKRANKSKSEIVEDMQKISLQQFKEELQALEVKHGYRLEPAMYYSKMGVFPQLEVVRIKEEPKEESVV